MVFTARICAQGLITLAFVLLALPASAQSFLVQFPKNTALHPQNSNAPGQIKCQQIAGTDGYATMADGHQIYTFGFGALSGRHDIERGLSGTQLNTVFNTDPLLDPNGAITDPATMINIGVLDANQPAPMIVIDEDDELFLTLTNVGQIMRPDLFEQHTVHFHGYPNASAFFDGVPDASISINIAGSFTYYYTAPDAGTYFWHCHITPPEHLQMGMIGQLYVRPRQNRVAVGTDLRTALIAANRKAPGATDGLGCSDILCTGQTPAPAAGVVQTADAKYAYNDGDGSTRYDVEYPIQMLGFDPNFHFNTQTFNPEAFADMKDKYFLLNGRSYPDTVAVAGYNGFQVPADNPNPSPATNALWTVGSDGTSRPSQPMHSLITIPHGGKALLRLSNVSVTEHSTLATIGIPMTVIGINARLLRDMAGNNLYYNTNSVTMGGGEAVDVILDAADIPAGTYFLYSTNLDQLSNDAENFGGRMTEIVVL